MFDPFLQLDPKFTQKLKDLIVDCATAGVVMKPYFGIRDPLTQGKLWRQCFKFIE